MEVRQPNLSTKVVGQERKAIASVIAEALEGQVRYTGAPGFMYEVNDEKSAGSWTVDRDSVVHSPKISLNEIKSIRSVIDALNMAGLSAEGTMTITLFLEGFSETSLENLNNMLASKETLIKKAMSIERELVVLTENDEISFSFWNATLNADEVQTYITLAKQMAEHAKAQKRVLRNEKPADNEKYAFRCFLLRLGFIGDNFKTERKVLLSRLSGNGAYRKGRAKAVDENE
ncbi:MAG: virulence factor [Bacillaceae bacterium]|nr:MAG: virulence factor [Parageobacillus thermoglucosidasius]REJ20815.1 MAG: virulence factor [Bacillaceae bacterium]